MEEKLFKITLTDGTTLDNLKMNGNCFISNEKIEDSVFEANCSPVTISDGEIEEIHENMALVHVTPLGEGYWFALRDISAKELEQIKLRSDVDYIAMMASVEL